MVAMSKVTTLLIILTLLLCSTLPSYAARPNPALPEVITSSSTPTKTQHKDVEAGGRPHGDVVGDEKCEEGIKEEECLMRRTLVAHLDYIYTQSSKNP